VDYTDVMRALSIAWSMRAIVELLAIEEDFEKRLKLNAEYKKLFKQQQQLLRVDF
jgi:hypothetical protein